MRPSAVALLLPLLAVMGTLTAAEPAPSAVSSDDDLPQLVQVGQGSYASRPPRSQAARPGVPGRAGWGDLSQVFTHMPLHVTPGDHGAIPSTDWWTSLVTKKWGGQLWSYPAMLTTGPQGVTVAFPKRWVLDGRTAHLEADTRLLVRGAGFTADSALAESWSDWLVTFRLAAAATAANQPAPAMRVTMGHGLPTTWFETTGIELRIDPGASTMTCFGDDGAALTLPRTADHLGVELAGEHGADCYALAGPAGTVFSRDGAAIAVRYPAGARNWLAVAVLAARADLPLLARHAPAVPRDTRIAWDYRPAEGRVATTWTVETENLAGGAGRDVVQGWIPHHYNTKPGTTLGFTPGAPAYATPRGELRCAVGRSFAIAWPFAGLLPELPAPSATGEAGMANPFRPAVMDDLLRAQTAVTGYGFETYWGGKKILLFAKYMEMAWQCGRPEFYAVFRDRLREALVDWATWTPGEPDHFFAMYPNWGSLLGFRTRDNQNPGIDILQDHAFCYGYHVYAAALLALHDARFARDYGGMATLMVKDYANWDRADRRFPFFRSFDPWCGHSWSGGPGSATGNGMESSSESMQAWGAMFLLGEALGDAAMRDAGAFGWSCEARGVAEYWFDRNRTNIPRPLWPNPYSGNTGTEGIGWWTWFSGDPFWMHAIQWLPMSPLLRYLGEDPAFAKWDYEQMWKTKAIGGWERNLGDEPGVGNVTLSYLALFDADQAARIFDELWDANRRTAHATDEPGATYYRIHAGRALGRMRNDAWTDIPTSMVFRDAAGATVAAVYNARDEERPCRVFDQGTLVATIRVPPRRLVAHRLDARPTAVVIADPGVIAPGATVKLGATVRDQYDATSDPGAPLTWSVSAGGRIAADGTFTAGAAGTVRVTAASGALRATRDLRVGAPAVPTALVIVPAGAGTLPASLAPGEAITVTATCRDQYGDPCAAPLHWSVAGALALDGSGDGPEARITTRGVGPATVTVRAGAAQATLTLALRMPPPDLSRGRPASASSGAGDRAPAMAVDGERETRWQSKAEDDQWLMVDLGADCTLDHAALHWEAAFGADYDIEASLDGKAWTVTGSRRDGTGGEEQVALTGHGRYVRLHGKKRGTNWGYSLFSFAVHGTPPASGSGPHLAAITVEPPLAQLTDKQTVRFTASGFDQDGKPFAITPQWSVVGKGTVAADGTFTPTGGCDFAQPAFTITASVGAFGGSAQAVVEESRRVARIQLSPDPGTDQTLAIARGGSRRFTAEVADQFTARYTLPPTWTASGAVTVAADGTVTASGNGAGTVTASAGGVSATVALEVRAPEDMDLAAGRPASASSSAGGNTPDEAVDGSMKTRWESAHADQQWLAVDLGASYALRRVVLRWENARASAYRIEVSDDGTTWREVFSTTTGSGREDVIDLAKMASASGRQVRLFCVKRATGYGNSLFAIEVYGTPKK